MTAQSHTCDTRTLLPWLVAQQRTPERPAMTPTYPAATVPLQGPVRVSERSPSPTAVSGPRRLWLPARRW